MKVKRVTGHGRAALIEWVDGGVTKRGYLPAEALTRDERKQKTYEPNQYDVKRPDLAAPYGLPWADLVKLTVTPKEIEDALHQYGIWTAADIERNHTQALAAIQSVYARVLKALIDDACGYQSAMQAK